MKVIECAEISKALQYSSFSAKNAKVSFEDLSAYISVISSKTRMSSETIGNALEFLGLSGIINKPLIKLSLINGESPEMDNAQQVIYKLNYSCND